MRQWISIGPVSIRLHSKHLAPWGFPRLQIGGYSFWSWNNNGYFMPAGYHPRGSITWIWSTTIVKAPLGLRYCDTLGVRRHSNVWLPFGWRLIVSRQKPMWKEVTAA
jgi:hypothetical protein